MARLEVAIVEWGDAHSDFESHDESDVDKFHGPCICYSAGHVVRKDREGITLAGCKDEDSEYDRLLFIPRGMIRRIQYFRTKARVRSS